MSIWIPKWQKEPDPGSWESDTALGRTREGEGERTTTQSTKVMDSAKDVMPPLPTPQRERERTEIMERRCRRKEGASERYRGLFHKTGLR